jgi:hypothetical protein
MLFFSDGEPFATGSIECELRPFEQEDNNRIFIPVAILEQETNAVLDTGGIYCILHPAIAELTEISQFDSIGNRRIAIRGTSYDGSLYKADLEIYASSGNNLSQEVTVFVPDCTIEEWGDRPTFLGLSGCMQNIRFAFDPENDKFYFSSLGES